MMNYARIILVLFAYAFLAPSHAQALECPAGQRAYTDYSTETPSEYCGAIENETGVEQERTYQNRSELSEACRQNTVNCSPSEKAFISGLVPAVGIVSPPECQKAGGYWYAEGDPYKCEFSKEVYQRLEKNKAQALQEAYQQANQQAVRTTDAAPASATNKFCGSNPSRPGECTYTPLEPLPVPGGAQTGTDFSAFMSGVFRVLITFGGLFAVVMLTVAGIGYMLSESALDIDRAKDRAKAALWGLVLLIGSWLILNTINPKILQFDLLRSTVEQLRTGAALPGGAPQNNAPSASGSNQASKSACEANNGAYNPRPDGSWGCDYIGPGPF